jgi:hypothetical protein
MDNGHMNGIFSGNSEITNDLNSENWQKSLEISKPVNLPAPEKIASTEDTELTTPETPVPEGPATLENSATLENPANSDQLGQITPVTTEPNLDLQNTIYNPSNIKTTGDYLDKGSMAEIEKLEDKLSQDGDLNSFYDETRNLTAVNLSNSFNRKLYDNGGES